MDFQPLPLETKMQRILHFRKSAYHGAVLPILRLQEIPFDDPDSNCMFTEKRLNATASAIKEYQYETIAACLLVLQEQAEIHYGIDYFQIFNSPEPGKPDLWFFENTDGEISALLPTDF